MKFILLLMTIFSYVNVYAQKDNRLIRLARLQIDSLQLNEYYNLLKEEITTSLRVEPGVHTLYAVAEKNRPAYITILEIYADDSAYRKHLQTPHFLKYKNGTKDMVKSLELVETDPILPDLILRSR